MLAREQGLDVVAVGALVDTPLTSMIWLAKSGIKGIGGLRGKTIATAGIPYQDAYLKTILARANLSPSDVKAVNVGFGLLPALVGGSAQAMLGGFSNVEGVDLRERGEKPVVTPVDQLGVPTYDELVLVAQAQEPGRRPGADQALPRRPLARHGGRGREPEDGGRRHQGSEPEPRSEAGEGRGEGDPAAALADRLHEPGRVDEVHRLDARQRPDLPTAAGDRSAGRLLPAGQDLRIAGQPLGQHAG